MRTLAKFGYILHRNNGFVAKLFPCNDIMWPNCSLVFRCRELMGNNHISVVNSIDMMGANESFGCSFTVIMGNNDISVVPCSKLMGLITHLDVYCTDMMK